MNVLIIGSFPETARNRIEALFPGGWTLHIAPPEDAARYLPQAEVVIPEHIRINSEFLDRAPKLRMVQTGAGYDNVDVEACTGRGIRVCNAAGINAQAVAEHTMALLLSYYKNIPCLDSFMKARREEQELSYSGGELAGKTVGIIGTGNIGRRVASCCQAFGMHVLGYSRRNDAVSGIGMVGLEELLRRSDVISVHVPLTEETRGMLGRGEFEKMKRSAVLINTSRGAVIDEEALAEALRSGRIAGACLDVFEQEPLSRNSPLRDLENVLLTPHTAGFPDGVKYHEGRYRFFARNIERLAAGQRPEHSLNEV